jgi:hypothetical protein
MSATNNTSTNPSHLANQTGKSATPGRQTNVSVGVSSTRYGNTGSGSNNNNNHLNTTNNINNSNSKRASPKKRTNTSLRQPSSNGHHHNNTSKSHSLDLDMSSGGDYGGGPEMSINRGVALPPFDFTKRSSKKNGIVKAYAANTHQGLIRKYNEDRVSIILNIMRPTSARSNEEWPACSFFAVYDGHGGTTCADFLRDNLHQYVTEFLVSRVNFFAHFVFHFQVIKDSNFPWNPQEALRRGCIAAEKHFLEIAQSRAPDIDRSGSCAIIVLIVG